MTWGLMLKITQVLNVDHFACRKDSGYVYFRLRDTSGAIEEHACKSQMTT